MFVTFQIITEGSCEIYAAGVAVDWPLDGEVFEAVGNGDKAKSGDQGGDTVVLCHYAVVLFPFSFIVVLPLLMGVVRSLLESSPHL